MNAAPARSGAGTPRPGAAAAAVASGRHARCGGYSAGGPATGAGETTTPRDNAVAGAPFRGDPNAGAPRSNPILLPRGCHVIRFVQVQKSFGAQPVLLGVSFDVPSGQTAALVGPNGAGKSTLLRIAAGEE